MVLTHLEAQAEEGCSHPLLRSHLEARAEDGCSSRELDGISGRPEEGHPHSTDTYVLNNYFVHQALNNVLLCFLLSPFTFTM